MTRLDALRTIPGHPWLGRVYARLSEAERIELEAFATAHDHLSTGDFDQAVNRMHLDVQPKPRRWKEVQEILSCVNSIARASTR
jgi:hypothetical protein